METQKKKFNLILLGVFLLFSVVIPIAYLVIRFNLFQETKLSIGLGGIIVIGILLGVIGVLIKEYLDGMKTKYSFLKKLLNGIIKVIMPLLLALVIITFIGDNVALIREALYILLPCETIAVITNPLPKWCFDNNVEGAVNIASRIFNKKESE